MKNSQQKPSSDSYDDEINLRELFSVLWVGKWLIGGVTVAATVIAVIVALMLPNIYHAEALLAPNDREGTSGLSALAAQYGGLAGLAGINLGRSSVDKTVLGLEILKSRKFISEFVEHRDILVPLLASAGWDSTTESLRLDPDIFDKASGKWVRRVSPPKATVPSSQEAYLSFMKIMSVAQNNKTGFVTIGIEHHSPTLAKLWVEWLVEDLNSTIVQQDVGEAEQAIEYLTKQIENTSIADLQKVFFSLIEEQTKTVMLAKVTDEYLLKTIDPAIVPEVKSRPKRSLIVVLSALIAAFLAMAMVLVLTSLRKERAGSGHDLEVLAK